MYSIWNGIKILELINHYSLPYAIATPVSSLESEEREGGFQQEIKRARLLIQSNNIKDVPAIIKKARSIKGYERDREALQIKETVAAYFPKHVPGYDRKEILGAWLLNVLEGHTGGVNSVAVTEDDRYILSGSEDRTLRLWELAAAETKGVFQGHEDSVRSVAISANGRYALSASNDRTLRLWDIPTGKCRGVFKGHTASVGTVLFGTDNRYALSQDDNGIIHLWDLLKKDTLRTIYVNEDSTTVGSSLITEHSATIGSGQLNNTTVALYPDLRYAITGRGDGVISVWDIALEERLRSFKMLNNSITALAVSSDGRFILTGGLYEGAIQLWGFRSGRLIRSFKGHTGEITTVCFSSDVKCILSAGTDETIRIWDIETSRELRKFILHGSKIRTAIFSPSGWLAITGGADKMLNSFYLDWDIDVVNYEDWDDRASPYVETFLTLHTPLEQNTLMRKGKPKFHQEDSYALIKQMSLSGFGWLTPEGILQKLRQLEKNAVDRLIESEQTFNKLLDLSRTLMSTADTTRCDKDSNSPCTWMTALETIMKARSIKGYARHEELLRAYEKISSVFPKKNLLSAWKVRYLARLSAERSSGRESEINTMAFSLDNRYVITGGADRNIFLWDLQTHRAGSDNSFAETPIRVYTGHMAEITSTAFIKNKRFLSGSADRTLRLWDIDSGQCLKVFKEHSEAITSIWADRNGLIAVCGSIDGSIRIWDIESGDILQIYNNPSGSVNSLTVSPDMALMLTGGNDRSLTLWQLCTGQRLYTMQGHSDVVNSVAISPNGRFAISASEDRTIRTWDITSGKAISTYEGHTAGVTAVEISPDGAFAISAGRDNKLCLWTLSDKNKVHTLKGHNAPVTAAALSPNGFHLISAAQDRSICLWYLQWEVGSESSTDLSSECLVYIENFLIQYKPLMKDSLLRKGGNPCGVEVS